MDIDNNVGGVAIESTQLLACPFCGGKGETQEVDDPDSTYYPQCTGCSWCDVWFTGRDSEAQWNARANAHNERQL